MTALVGMFGRGAESAPSAVPAMLASMRNRGDAVPEEFSTTNAYIAARRYEWEPAEKGWTGPVITVRDDWVVTADASLYYLADLRRKLALDPGRSAGASSGELIVAAIRKWGDGFAKHLEGDFAIVALHRPTGRVLLARDFVGKRALAYAIAGDGTLIVASSPRAIVRFPAIPATYDSRFLASSISGLLGHGNRTAFAAVSVVPGGATLAYERNRLTTLDQWAPPPFSSEWTNAPSDDAADHVRRLLEDAVLERMPDQGGATVWMSGGWDSTSVFAAGRAGLGRRGNDSVQLQPVSMRYPKGDPGDESHFIEAVAQRWAANVRWISVDTMPLFEDANRRAAVRDDPRVSPFEAQIRAMCAVTRESRVRVVLDGAGGDHVFMVSSAAILADHLLTGRLGALRKEWLNWGQMHPRTYARLTLLPLLSTGVLEWIGAVRGRPLRGLWQEEVPPWVRSTPDLLSEAVPHIDRELHEGVAAWETRRVLTTPLVARALSWTHPMALEEGILLRSPMFDRRLIEFTATRPLNERHGGADGKVILRRAMRELLPAAVLEVRGRKTGTPAQYFKREMQKSARSEFDTLFGSEQSRLADLGIVDLAALRSSMDEYERTGVHGIGAMLQLTMEAERWLAAQESAPEAR